MVVYGPSLCKKPFFVNQLNCIFAPVGGTIDWLLLVGSIFSIKNIKMTDWQLKKKELLDQIPWTWKYDLSRKGILDHYLPAKAISKNFSDSLEFAANIVGSNVVWYLKIFTDANKSKNNLALQSYLCNQLIVWESCLKRCTHKWTIGEMIWKHCVGVALIYGALLKCLKNILWVLHSYMDHWWNDQKHSVGVALICGPLVKGLKNILSVLHS